jgi:hypothetical protein
MRPVKGMKEFRRQPSRQKLHWVISSRLFSWRSFTAPNDKADIFWEYANGQLKIAYSKSTGHFKGSLSITNV